MNRRFFVYEKQGYSAKKAKKRAEKNVAIPNTSEHQLGLSVDINADTDKCTGKCKSPTYLSDWELCISTNSACNGNVYRDGNSLTAFYV